jgi:hypothetical protein
MERGDAMEHEGKAMTDPSDTYADCMCDFGDHEDCNGSGTRKCYGCGGDTCVCRCGGELDCEGCGACEDNER